MLLCYSVLDLLQVSRHCLLSNVFVHIGDDDTFIKCDSSPPFGSQTPFTISKLALLLHKNVVIRSLWLWAEWSWGLCRIGPDRWRGPGAADWGCRLQVVHQGSPKSYGLYMLNFWISVTSRCLSLVYKTYLTFSLDRGKLNQNLLWYPRTSNSPLRSFFKQKLDFLQITFKHTTRNCLWDGLNLILIYLFDLHKQNQQNDCLSQYQGSQTQISWGPLLVLLFHSLQRSNTRRKCNISEIVLLFLSFTE